MPFFFSFLPPQCGESQSVLKVWGQGGRAKDLRGLVMDLNAAAGRGEDLTATLQRAVSSTSTSTSLPHPLYQARNGRNHAAPTAALSRDRLPLGRDKGLHNRQALLLRGVGGDGGGGSSSNGLQNRRSAEGTAEADPVDIRQARFEDPRFGELRFDEHRFDEQRFDEDRIDDPGFKEPHLEKPAPVGFMSGRDRRDNNSFGRLGAAAAGDTLHGGTHSTGEGGHVRQERRNGEYADDANLGRTAGGDYRACEGVGIEAFGKETHAPRPSAVEATRRDNKASRWGAFAVVSNRGSGVDRLEKHRRGQREFDQQVKARCFFVVFYELASRVSKRKTLRTE